VRCSCTKLRDGLANLFERFGGSRHDLRLSATVSRNGREPVERGGEAEASVVVACSLVGATSVASRGAIGARRRLGVEGVREGLVTGDVGMPPEVVDSRLDRIELGEPNRVHPELGGAGDRHFRYTEHQMADDRKVLA
jgi:hypothetical protein